MYINNIEVSVYCLAFNHEKYIRRCLEGFVSQITNFKFEVFVHDDASTDKTAEIIKEFEVKYPNIIKPIYQKENQYSKKVKIVNTFILPKMTGRYIAVCEGDDYWTDKYKLQKQYDALEKNPNCFFCTHLVKCRNEDDSPNDRVIPDEGCNLASYNGVICKDEIARLLWEGVGYPFQTSSYFFRKEIKTSLCNLDSFLVRDVGLLKKAILFGDFFYLSDPMSVRRLNTIGNWNSRMDANGGVGRKKLLLSDFAMDKEFDSFTNYQYSSYIIPVNVMRLVSSLGFDFDQAKKLFDEYCQEVKWKNIKNTPLGFKSKMKLYLLKYAPFILKVAYGGRLNG